MAKRKKSALRSYLHYRAITFMSVTFPESVLYWAAERLADYNYHRDGKGRETVKKNLRRIMGPRANEKLIAREARWVFRNFGWNLAEFFGYRRFGGEFLDDHVDIAGIEHIEKALAEGKGVVATSGHLSNWEIGAAKIARMGIPTYAVGYRHIDEGVERIFERQRASRDYHVIHREGAVKEAVRLLRANNLFCILSDRTMGEPGVEVDFFGARARFVPAAARLSIMTGAPMIPAFIVRKRRDSFLFSVEPPIPVPEKGSSREKARMMTQEFARIEERYVCANPAQWAIFFPYWDPEGEKEFMEDLLV